MQYAHTGVRNGLCHQYGRSQDCIVSVRVVRRARALSQFLLGGHPIVSLRVVAHGIYCLQKISMERLAIVFAVFLHGGLPLQVVPIPLRSAAISGLLQISSRLSYSSFQEVVLITWRNVSFDIFLNCAGDLAVR